MNNLTKYKILAFIRYFAESLFFPFISLYFKNIGRTESEIGIIIGIIPLVGLLCNPIYSRFCKNPKTTKNILTIIGVLESISVIILLFTSNFIMQLIMVIFLSIFSSSNYGMLDSLLTLSAKEHNKPFSSIRIFGSTSYMIGAFIAGYIAKFTSYNFLFVLAVIFFLVTSLILYLVKTPQTKESSNTNISYKGVLKNKVFIIYLIFYVLLIGSMQVADDFFSLYLTSKGAPDYYYSYVMLGYILVEVIIMFILSKYGNKIKNKLSLYFIAIIILIIRLIIQSLPDINITLLIISQISRGITWAIALYLSSTFILKLLGTIQSTRGMMLVMMIQQIFTSLFKFVGGFIIELYGYYILYLILLIITIISLIIFIIYYLKYIKNKEELLF